MATPTFFVPPPTAEEIARSLEEEVRRQQEATPEPIFREQNVVQSYDYLCEIEHKRFTPDEVDNFRMGITESSYWECEARHLKDQLSELIWQNLLHEYRVDGMPTTDGWRDVAMAYRHRLRRHGSSTQQLRESRLSIKDQSYWKPEAECLRGFSALREHEMQEKYWERKANIQGIPSPAESETQYAYSEKQPRRQRQTLTKQPTRRSRRSQPNVGQPRADRVSDKRRSGLRSSTASKVGKRRGKVGKAGVKARQP